MWQEKTVSVVLMTYAEKDSIRQVITDFYDTGYVDEILVINNNAEAGTSEEVAEAYRVVRHELEAYGEGLAEKPEIVALSKCDAMSEDEIKAQIKALKKAAKKTPLVLSSQSGKGVKEVLRALLDVIDKARQIEEPKPDKVEAWQP